MNKRHVQHTRPVRSAQVRSALETVLTTHVAVEVQGRHLDEPRLWDLLITAAVQQTTIEAVCTELADAPSGNTVREHLGHAVGASPADLAELEQRLQGALQAQVPRHFRRRLERQALDVALDLVQIPYHGRLAPQQQEVRRGPAKSGTTHFYTYATLAIVHDEERYELALTFVWKGEPLVAVVERLIHQARKLGLRIRHAYLDKGFRGSEILRWLRRHRIPYVIPVPLNGRALKALCTGRRSYRTRFTFNPRTHRRYTTDLVMVCKYRQGRTGRHGVVYLVYAVYGGEGLAPQAVHELYRRRFGIESGYRQLHQVRARTTSRNPVLRLLLIGLALLILNTYLALRQVWLMVHHYGSRTRRRWLTLRRLRTLFVQGVERLLEVSGLEQVARSQIDLHPIS